MKEQTNRFIKQAEKFINEESEPVKNTDNQLHTALTKVFRYLFYKILPVLVSALVINLTIMFTAPYEVAFSEWFWLKDPVSLVTGYILVKVFNSFRKSFQPHNN